MHTLTDSPFDLCQKFPLREHAKDLVYVPEVAVNDQEEESSSASPFPGNKCTHCDMEMEEENFKYCSKCGEPNEKVVPQKKAPPRVSRKKILGQAISEIVSANNNHSSSLSNLTDTIDPQQNIWFVVKHPLDLEGPLDYSLQSASLKQVSPTWLSFFGYKRYETQRSFLSKFVAPRVDLSPKALSQWHSLADHTTRSSTVNYSCEFVLCHKHGILYGVELQVTSFTKNGKPDTSFVVVKRIWLLMTPLEATTILNQPNIEVIDTKKLAPRLGEQKEEDAEQEEEEGEDEPAHDIELLRKEVHHNKLGLI